ncbi:MAG TPA: transposase [Bacteroidia bacterium]|nr:transposase [Bacteroidia bacterium]
MPHAYQIHKQESAYFLTLTTVRWVDLFIREKYKQIICDSLNYCIEKKGLEVFCYVIMTSHIHLIARSKSSDLSKVMRDFKKFTSGSLINEIRFGPESRKEWLLKIFAEGDEKQTNKSGHQLWKYNNHAEEVYSPRFTLSKIKYIHNNPVMEGIVEFPEQYYYSSARDYAGLKGLVNVSVINLHNLYY